MQQMDGIPSDQQRLIIARRHSADTADVFYDSLGEAHTTINDTRESNAAQEWNMPEQYLEGQSEDVDHGFEQPIAHRGII